MKLANNNKLKIVMLIEILEEETDEKHGISMDDIITKLANRGVSAERKSIYTDIAFLQDIGYDIVLKKGNRPRYFLASRYFELSELKLLVDAVHSSRFITKKHSENLIKKLMKFTSKYQMNQLNRQVVLTDVPKSFNKSILYSIDTIHYAINEKKKISFRYYHWNASKERVFRKKDDDLYVLSPLALCWNNDKYYLICYNQKYDNMNSYRVDRMEKVNKMEQPWDEKAHIQEVDTHVKSLFGMYDGQKMKAILEFDKELVNAVTDEYGFDIAINDKGETFSINVLVSESKVFLSWMIQFGDKARIVAPVSLRDSMKELLKETLQQYD